MAMAAVGLMIASGYFMFAEGQSRASPSMSQFSDWVSTGNKSGTPVRVQVVMSDMTTIVDDAKYHGVANTMFRAADNSLIIMDRNGTSHVSPTDFASMKMYRSINDGVTWSSAVGVFGVPNRDIRNYAGGVAANGKAVVFFSSFDTANYTTGNDIPHHTLGFIWSTNNGTSWNGPSFINPSTIGGVVPTGASPYGQVIVTGSGYLGVAVCIGNATKNHAVYLRSTDNGTTWSQIQMSSIGTYGSTWYSETSVVYLGNDQLVALSRIDGSANFEMETSINNGASWTDRGPVNLFGPKTVALVPYHDVNGGIWVLALIDYGRYLFSYGYGPNLIAEGISAWSILSDLPAQGITGFGCYIQPVWDPAYNNWIVVGETNAGTSDITKHTVTMQVLLPGTGLLPANVHQYAMLVLVMFGLVMAVTTVGFMSKAKDKGISKEDVVELSIFLVISLILMAVLITILGPV